MKNILLILLSIPLFTISQETACISGNCVNGYGTYLTSDGNKFVGYWENGKKIKGTFYYKKGSKYVGECNDNIRHGEGTYTWENGKYYKGSFVNGKMHGQGTKYSASASIEYSGQWSNNKPIDSKTYAVIVGVSDYMTGSDLNYCDDDANHFYNFLKSKEGGGVPHNNIKLLLNQNATKKNILSALKTIFSKATENDFVIFYFSGHGNEGIFCPTDYSYNTWLSHSDIKSAFKLSKANNKLCIADACYSGSIRNSSKKLSITKSLEKSYNQNESIVVLTSSKSTETSIERGSLRQGVFTYYLINGLTGSADKNNDGVIYADELFNYLKVRVSSNTQNKQNPIIFGKNIKLLTVGYVMER